MKIYLLFFPAASVIDLRQSQSKRKTEVAILGASSLRETSQFCGNFSENCCRHW